MLYEENKIFLKDKARYENIKTFTMFLDMKTM